MSLYDRIADIPVTIADQSFSGLERTGPFGVRRTTVVSLKGKGFEGQGEDVTYDELAHPRLQSGELESLSGEYTLDDFSARIGELDLFFDETPGMPVYPNYRRWAIESAALDLALRQAKRFLADVLEIEPQPIRFVASPRIPLPPSFDYISSRLNSYPALEFKLDYDPSWSEQLIEQLARTNAVGVIDFKGAYKGTPVDVDTDAALYRRIAEQIPNAVLEDPDLTDPDAAQVLKPYHDRISWDAPIHSVDEIKALSFEPKFMNIKPSRFGSLKALFDAYDYCKERGMTMYGGGQSELGVGRGQIQYLASLFHPDGPNDIAPAGYDWVEVPEGLPVSPLSPQIDHYGFQRIA